MSFNQLAFSFSGRMRRRDFWLGQILLAFVIGFIAMILIPAVAEAFRVPRSVVHLSANLGWFIRLLLLWPALAIAVKRGHDRNRPAAWIILLYALVSAVEFLAPLSGSFGRWLVIAEFAFLAYVVVDLGVLDGAKGENRFGPSPKLSGSTEQAIA